MPLDSKTHRNLGYSFIQFSTVNDLIVAYENVIIPFFSLFLVARQEMAKIGEFEEMPFLLC